MANTKRSRLAVKGRPVLAQKRKNITRSIVDRNPHGQRAQARVAPLVPVPAPQNRNNMEGRIRRTRRKKYYFRPRFIKKYFTRSKARIAAAKAFTKLKKRIKRRNHVLDSPYTRTECHLIVEQLRKRKAYGFVKGIKIWKILQNKYFPKRRPESLREQFCFQVAPRLLQNEDEAASLFSMNSEELQKLKKGLAMKATSQRANNCPKSIFE